MDRTIDLSALEPNHHLSIDAGLPVSIDRSIDRRWTIYRSIENTDRSIHRRWNQTIDLSIDLPAFEHNNRPIYRSVGVGTLDGSIGVGTKPFIFAFKRELPENVGTSVAVGISCSIRSAKYSIEISKLGYP